MMNGNMFLEESFRVKPNFSFKDPTSFFVFYLQIIILPLEFEKDLHEKEHKKIYLDYIKKIITYMTKMSLTLKGIPPEERKAKMLEYIKRINGYIEAHRKKYFINEKNKTDVCFHSNGILIPFSPIGKSLFNSNLVKKNHFFFLKLRSLFEFFIFCGGLKN